MEIPDMTMIAFRFLWTCACGLFAAAGLAVAFTAPIDRVLVTYSVSVFFIAIATVQYNLFTQEPGTMPPILGLLANVASYALVGSAAIMALLGMGVFLGWWALALSALLTACSPWAVREYRRWLGAVCDPSAGSPDVVNHPAVDQRLARRPPTIRALSDTDLCRAWRASSQALQATSSPVVRAQVVEARSAYLDEFERRNADGFNACLAAGTAAEDVSVFLAGDTQDSAASIDWDGLIFGQDDS